MQKDHTNHKLQSIMTLNLWICKIQYKASDVKKNECAVGIWLNRVRFHFLLISKLAQRFDHLIIFPCFFCSTVAYSENKTSLYFYQPKSNSNEIFFIICHLRLLLGTMKINIILEFLFIGTLIACSSSSSSLNIRDFKSCPLSLTILTMYSENELQKI